MNIPTLTIVIPCFNEEEILQVTIKELSSLLERMMEDDLIANGSRLLFVDDGSKDETWSIIYRETIKGGLVKGLKLAKNAGHQNALLAGIAAAKETSDCIITIDADLQDDIAVIPQFIEKYREGCEIVYGVRSKRDTDTVFKRTTAQCFYKFMSIMGVDLVYNHADFRLLGKRAVEELAKFSESNMFLRGIVPLLGFQTSHVYYERRERLAGETKYPLKKMLSFAFDGITSFSITPIRTVLFLGILSFLGSLIFGAYFLFLKLLGHTETGWTSLILSIWLIGGLQLMALGLVGEYIGKIYKETKGRPKFIVDLDLYNFARTKKNGDQENDVFHIQNTRLSETN
ncbi:glycosyltransferase family 2 protein [Bacillus massilinigeriensis]|uniref:glycosyltransferase family 2 protein n=1 Tax=Bacillus mediterraneensis TaxID=1805474 RepID=UPI0008F9480B|nr:glycosyltransferase family 2 protein [Bacillus mediterraneensis]